jgi:murein DD-endopeptidase MepM/ murein hydrolase activator NlpD
MRNLYVLAIVAVVGVTIGGASIWRPRELPADPLHAPTLGVLYAAPVERVETHVLENGQTISAVLARAAINGSELAEVLLGLREHFNPRRLAGGVEITVRRWARDDSPRAVEVRVNADTTVRLVRDDLGWAGHLMLTPVDVDTMYGAGVIEAGRTLYEAIVNDIDSPLSAPERSQLVYALAEIYEYKLDFTREIQPGDRYRIVYEREARPDGSARDRRILAAEIRNGGRTYSAVWFDADEDVRGYYDAEGRPLRTGFSLYPVDFPRITSNFNPRRYHPILGVHRAHLGTDFGARSGTPVQTTADGTVVFAGYSGGYGNMVRIRHMNGYETRYAHLSRFGKGIRAGTRVKQKQVVGYVGRTGLATAPHLHYELRKEGRAINARTAKLPAAPPLAPSYRARFSSVAAERLALLEAQGRPLYATQVPAARPKRADEDGF